MIGKLESGELELDRSSEVAFIASLLKAFDVPFSSQLLVYSTTSLQLRLTSPRNPRAIYFIEDLYIGYIPSGRIEIVSIDPSPGGDFLHFRHPVPWRRASRSQLRPLRALHELPC